jgi:hypothetical protein
MKTSRSHSAAPHADRAAKEEHTKRRATTIRLAGKHHAMGVPEE